MVQRFSHMSETLVLYLILIIAFAINALVFLEYFAVPNGVQSVNFAYKETINYLKQRIHVQIDYAQFEQTFQCYVKIIFWTFLLTLVIKVIFVIDGDGRYFGMTIVFFYYLKHVVSLHIVFHVEFVHFLLQTINREFDTRCNQSEFMIRMVQSKPIELLQTLHQLKCVHFRVWKIVRVLNTRFGWILIALMLATILDISYSTYWMWIFIHNASDERIDLFMRKYFPVFWFS